MPRIIYRQLIGHEDLALGSGKVVQERGELELEFQQIELEFIFRTVDEIKALDYNKYLHIAIHQIGPVIQYYFDPTSYAIPDDVNVIKPNLIAITQAGRYILIGGTSDPDAPGDIFDTIIASCSDEYTPLTVDLVTPKTTFRAPYPFDMTNGYVRISLTTAPVGADLIVDLHMNGTSIFSTLLHIDDGDLTSVGSATPAVLNIPSDYVPDDAEFKPYVTQIGSSVAGTGLKIALSGVKTT